MKYNELAQKIMDLIGDEKNVNNLTHCVTRLRFVLKDNSKADQGKIGQLDGVMGVQVQGGQLQIIIGGKVGKIYKEIISIAPNLGQSSGNEDGPKEKKSIVDKVIDTLSAILVPSLPPVIGGGMLKGFLFLFSTLKLLSPDGGTYYILNIAADCMFYFFPFLLAVSAARKFKTNEYMALSLAGALMYPTLLNVATAGEIASIKFLGIFTIPFVNYSGSIVPIILSVWLLKYVYNFLEKRIPDMVTIIFTPLITLVIMVPIMLFAIAPLGYYIGEYVAIGITKLIDFSPIIAGFVIGATRPFLVLAGMHHAIRPITQQQIASFGYSSMGPMNFMSTMAQATACCAMYFLIKDKKLKQVSLSATISGYFGITEPALYGVLVKYKVAFAGASLGGGIGAAVGALLGARGYAPAMPSVLSIPVYLGENTIGFFIGFAITLVATFVITYILGKAFIAKETVVNAANDTTSEKKISTEQTIYEIYSPVSGEICPVENVPDQTFASKIMGEGVAILPSEEIVYSPVNGVINTVFKTKHAIGIVSDNNVELLIHIGINTVELEGKYFDAYVKEGDKVSVGDKILSFDLDKINKAGYDMTILMIVLNTNDYLSVVTESPSGKIRSNEKIMTIIS